MSTMIQRSFAGGEIAPALYSRVDQVKYSTGLRTCLNWYILRNGGVANRPGTEFIVEVKDSTKAIRLIPFIFSVSQTYVLEFGDQYIRFIRQGVQLEVSGVAAWNIATPYVVGDLVVEGGINYYCIAATTGDIPPNATYWYPLTGDIYEIPTPYLEADLAKLNFIQSADVITLVHPSYAPRELSRTGHTSWILDLITFAPSVDAPLNLAISGAAGTENEWVVTAVLEETYEESVQSISAGSSAKATASLPRTLTWDVVANAQEYNVYKKSNGIYGFVGVAGSNEFEDTGIFADVSDTPPGTRDPFSGANNYPTTTNYYQQRLGFANTNNDTEKIWFSRTGNFHNFTTSSPLQDDDAVTFSAAGSQVNAIKSMVDLGKLIILTESGEWEVQGNDAGTLLPGEINIKQQSYHGSGDLRPLLVGASVLFIQPRGSIIRDLIQDIIEGYKGNDLTIFATHLFENNTIVDWDYQKTPDSIVWAVRSDGVLLGISYIREHQLWGWHRHEFSGTVENVVSIPEGIIDGAYITVKRTIDGNVVRYIERFSTRNQADVIDNVLMDSALTYDGRNTSSVNPTWASITMTLSGGTTWDYTDNLTLTSNAVFFTAGDVGNAIHLTGSGGTLIKAKITAFTSTTEVTVKPQKTVPTTMRNIAITTWGRAVDVVAGLAHIEGEDVSVFADRYVVASPNNPSMPVVTVATGSITLDKPYVVIHAGLPVTADLETLDIDAAQGESVVDKKKLIGKVNLIVDKTRGLWAGGDSTDLNDLTEYKLRDEEGYEDPVDLKTGTIEVNIQPQWNSNGRVLIRQIDPVPATVLAIVPIGLVPFKGGK